MQVELLRGAEADLLENYVRFEESREGLGDRFYRRLITRWSVSVSSRKLRRSIKAHIAVLSCVRLAAEFFIPSRASE